MTSPLALGCAGALVAWSNAVLPALGQGPWGRTAANTVCAAALAAATRASGVTARDLGWARPVSGLRWGSVAALVPVAMYAVVLAVPAGRKRLAGGDRRTDYAAWVAVHIPLGTVLSEELLFRSVLHAFTQLPASPDGPASRSGRVLASAAFGLWHMAPARAAGDSIPGTVVLTALSGLVFDELRRRSGSVLAPALLHLAVNLGGAVAVRLASRDTNRR